MMTVTFQIDKKEEFEMLYPIFQKLHKQIQNLK